MVETDSQPKTVRKAGLISEVGFHPVANGLSKR
jgi:hypothetical protein